MGGENAFRKVWERGAGMRESTLSEGTYGDGTGSLAQCLTALEAGNAGYSTGRPWAAWATSSEAAGRWSLSDRGCADRSDAPGWHTSAAALAGNTRARERQGEGLSASRMRLLRRGMRRSAWHLGHPAWLWAIEQTTYGARMVASGMS